MSELAWLPLTDASALIHAGDLSPVEYTRALIEHIQAHDGVYHAFLTFIPEQALRDAARAEDELVAGVDRGPLHGIPFGLKDIIDAHGLPTTAHSRILREHVAQADARVTARLREAGAILLGKLSTHEFAAGGPSFDLPWPPARNPWDPERFAGGSSSGSAVAVAAGFLPLAIGTDTGGSIRNPAGLCGVVGLKPTHELVSRSGVFPLSYSLDHVGPITRTVTDNATALESIAEPVASWSGASVPASRQPADLRGLRVGVIRRFFKSDMVAATEVAAAVQAVATRLTELGAIVADMDAPPLAEFAAANRVLLFSEAFAVHGPWLRERPQDYGAIARERLLTGAFLTAADYVDAMRARGRLVERFAQAFHPYDVALTVNGMDQPCRVDDDEALQISFRRHARPPFSLTGHPAMALPAGFDATGLPLSVQLVGRHHGEAVLYRVAGAYERSCDWAGRRPALRPR